MRLRRNIWQIYGFTWAVAGDSLFAARCPNMDPHWATKCHRWGNSIWSDRWFEAKTSHIPCENSDHWAKEPHAPSTCENFHLLNKIHPRIYSEPCWNRRDSPFAARSPNMDPLNVKEEEKMPIIFTPAEDRTRDSLHVNPNLYRAAMKAGLYRKAVQMCCVPNTSTYSGIHRGYLPPSVAGSYQICKIFFFFFFQLRGGRLGLFIVSRLETWKEED